MVTDEVWRGPKAARALAVGRRISRAAGWRRGPRWWHRSMACAPAQYSCGVRRTRMGAAATPRGDARDEKTRGDGGGHTRDGEIWTAAGSNGESTARARRRRLEWRGGSGGRWHARRWRDVPSGSGVEILSKDLVGLASQI